MERFDTVVIGGSQAGLATGYYLSKQSRAFVILEAGAEVGAAWRKRWDTLHLFTGARFNSLPGMPFPAGSGIFPSKDEMADYLAAYAAHFSLPVQLGVKVDDLTRADDHYLITVGARRLQARHVVVATGAYTTPRVPAFASQLDPTLTQLHSVDYRNPRQLRNGPVLVVGAGNSGAEIAYDLAATRPTWLAGRDTGMIPGELGSVSHQVGALVFKGVAQRLTVDTLPGRWLVGKAKGLTGGHPVVRLRANDLLKAGVQRVPRVAGVSKGRPVLESGQELDVANVVWATGFVRDYRWIRLPVFDAGGTPRHHRGLVQTEPGLYFAGLPFQSSLLSGLVAGAGPDARYIVQQITARDRAAHPTLARRPQRLLG